MLSVHVVLHDANTRKTSEIARMTIVNDGSGRHASKGRGNYVVRTLRPDEEGKFYSDEVLDTGFVRNYARQALPVWYLVMCALHACGYRLPGDVFFAPVFPQDKIAPPRKRIRTRKKKAMP